MARFQCKQLHIGFYCFINMASLFKYIFITVLNLALTIPISINRLIHRLTSVFSGSELCNGLRVRLTTQKFLYGSPIAGSNRPLPTEFYALSAS